MKEWKTWVDELTERGDSYDEIMWQQHMLQKRDPVVAEIEEQGKRIKDAWMASQHYACDVVHKKFRTTKFFKTLSDAGKWLDKYVIQYEVTAPKSGYQKILVKNMDTGDIPICVEIGNTNADTTTLDEVLKQYQYKLIRQYSSGGHDVVYYSSLELLDKDLDHWIFKKDETSPFQKDFDNKFSKLEVLVGGKLCREYVNQSGRNWLMVTNN